MEKPVCISLFSGGMGLDLGLEEAGFSLRFAADNMAAAVETARFNRPTLPMYGGDIQRLSGLDVLDMADLKPGQVDLLAGGPPCQSFSTAGKRLGLDDTQKGPLVFDFVRLLDELQPQAFLMENVKGLLSASAQWRKLPYNNNGKIIDDLHGSVFRKLQANISELGYSFKHMVVNTADFGVPQTRTRVILLGYRDHSEVTFPTSSHAKIPTLLQKPWQTLTDALNGLDEDDSHCVSFSARKLQYLRMIPPGGNWRNLPEKIQRESMGRAYFAKGGRSGYWRRLSPDLPSPTILTEPQNASTSLCHPFEDRPLSVRECARIQTFPDSWVFCGSGRDQYKLVGNAVPVLLGRKLGTQIIKDLYAAQKGAAKYA